MLILPTCRRLRSEHSTRRSPHSPTSRIRPRSFGSGKAACWVDRLEGCRDALWRVVQDARGGGAVASGIIAMLELAYDDLETGHWDDAERLVDEAIGACETHGYQPLTWLGRFFQGMTAAAARR